MFEGEKDMSQTKQFVMTYEGVKKLEEELEYLKTVKRKEIIEKAETTDGNKENSEKSEKKHSEKAIKISTMFLSILNDI